MKKTISHFNLFLLVLPLFTVPVNPSDAQQRGAVLPAKRHACLMMATDQLMAWIDPFLNKKDYFLNDTNY